MTKPFCTTTRILSQEKISAISNEHLAHHGICRSTTSTDLDRTVVVGHHEMERKKRQGFFLVVEKQEKASAAVAIKAAQDVVQHKTQCVQTSAKKSDVEHQPQHGDWRAGKHNIIGGGSMEKTELTPQPHVEMMFLLQLLLPLKQSPQCLTDTWHVPRCPPIVVCLRDTVPSSTYLKAGKTSDPLGITILIPCRFCEMS